MHFGVGPFDEPGFWSSALYSTPESASLSPIATEPDSIRLPEFEVVAVNAAEVTKTVSPAISATTAKVRKSLRFLVSVWGLLFIWILLAQMRPGFWCLLVRGANLFCPAE